MRCLLRIAFQKVKSTSNCPFVHLQIKIAALPAEFLYLV